MAKFLFRTLAVVLVLAVEGAIHYKVHPLNEVGTVKDALIVAFSFWPGIIVAYIAMGIERALLKVEDPEPPAAGAICGMLWFVYLFRALTLLVSLPALSDWTEKPVDWLVRLFEWVG